jgi:hypothetical protein
MLALAVVPDGAPSGCGGDGFAKVSDGSVPLRLGAPRRLMQAPQKYRFSGSVRHLRLEAIKVEAGLVPLRIEDKQLEREIPQKLMQAALTYRFSRSV